MTTRELYMSSTKGIALEPHRTAKIAGSLHMCSAKQSRTAPRPWPVPQCQSPSLGSRCSLGRFELHDVRAVGLRALDHDLVLAVHLRFFLSQSSSAVSPLLHPTTFRGPRLGLIRCVGQALATEAIAEYIRGGGVWEAESNIEWLDLVATSAAADWDASLTMERINL